MAGTLIPPTVTSAYSPAKSGAGKAGSSSEHPDVIVLEAMLPKLHGFDLCQKIYNETKGSVPVVIASPNVAGSGRVASGWSRYHAASRSDDDGWQTGPRS